MTRPQKSKSRAPEAEKGTKRDDAESALNCFRSLVRALRIADRAALAESGVGSAQVFVLQKLLAEPHLSVGELADRTATDQSTVSVVVAKLVEKGLVTRTVSETDGRRSELALTTAGRSIAKRVPAAFQQSFLDAVRALPERRMRDLAKTLQDIVHILGADEEPPPMLLEDGGRNSRRTRR